jgi:hypothetical protein
MAPSQPTAGGGQWLGSVEVCAVAPAHRASEILVAATEVGSPGEKPQVGSGERLDLVGLGQRSKGVNPPSPLVAVAAAFPDVRGRRLHSVHRLSSFPDRPEACPRR